VLILVGAGCLGKDINVTTTQVETSINTVVNPQDSLEVNEDGLKTFVNNASGVSFKFPADKTVFWSVDWNNKKLIPAGPDTVGAAIVESTDDFFAGTVEAVGMTYAENFTIDGWIAEGLPNWIQEDKIVKHSNIKIGGKQAVQILGPGDQTGFYKVVLVQHGDNLIILRQDRDNDFLNIIFSSIEFRD